MIDPKAVAEIQQAPIPERIQVMEDILQSLRKDIATAAEGVRNWHQGHTTSPPKEIV